MNKVLQKIVWLIIVAPIIYLAITWNKIPDKIATQFDFNGIPKQFGNKNQLWIGIGVITVVSLLVYLLLIRVYRIDPKKHASENKDRLLRIAFTIVVFMSIVSTTIIHSSINEGGIKFNIHFVFATMGFFWAILGNYMHNIKPNYFAGFRLPWTLESEENWRKTHLLGGKLWFFGGLVIGVVWLFSSNTIGLIITFVSLLIMINIPIICSYKYYKKEKSRQMDS